VENSVFLIAVNTPLDDVLEHAVFLIFTMLFARKQDRNIGGDDLNGINTREISLHNFS